MTRRVPCWVSLLRATLAQWLKVAPVIGYWPTQARTTSAGAGMAGVSAGAGRTLPGAAGVGGAGGGGGHCPGTAAAEAPEGRLVSAARQSNRAVTEAAIAQRCALGLPGRASNSIPVKALPG